MFLWAFMFTEFSLPSTTVNMVVQKLVCAILQLCLDLLRWNAWQNERASFSRRFQKPLAVIERIQDSVSNSFSCHCIYVFYAISLHLFLKKTSLNLVFENLAYFSLLSVLLARYSQSMNFIIYFPYKRLILRGKACPDKFRASKWKNLK